jgi:hypothetical protein
MAAMLRSSLAAIALLAALNLTLNLAPPGARAQDATYPAWKGQWIRIGGVQWDPSKPPGRGQQAPLTPEYQAIFEANLADQIAGGRGNNPTLSCMPPGMPRAMTLVEPMEVIITPDVTYIALAYMSEFRRIYTDGRDWPQEFEPSFAGYSIGKWVDEDGDGRYDALTIETRGLKGPRLLDSGGMPLHKNNQTVVKERISLDKADPEILHNEITTTDTALTRPWTVTKNYRRTRKSNWIEYVCAEDNHQIVIGDENYMVSAEGYLMPTRKDQPAPDLKYFNQARK